MADVSFYTEGTCVYLGNMIWGFQSYKPNRVVFNNPYTIAYFADGAKVVVKCNAEKFDEEKGVMACIIKHLYGNRSEFLRVIESAERPVKKNGQSKSEKLVGTITTFPGTISGWRIDSDNVE